MVGEVEVPQTHRFSALHTRCGRKSPPDVQKLFVTLPAPCSWRRCVSPKNQRVKKCPAVPRGQKRNIAMTDIRRADSERRRRRLPDRRQSETFCFELGGLHFSATISRFADGSLAELFLNNHKFGNQSDTNARDAAILF